MRNFNWNYFVMCSNKIRQADCGRQ